MPKLGQKGIVPILIILILAALAGGVIFQQYTVSQQSISCGGDWNYNVKCPVGSYCKSMGQGPLVGGLCKPYLQLLFESISPPKQPQVQQTATPSPSPAEETANWKTYTNLGVEFKYPPETILKEDTNHGTQDVADFEIQNKKFRFDRLASNGSVPAYQQTNITKDFNGLTWKASEPDKDAKYCDAGDCSSISPSYYVFKDGFLYSFTYYSDELKPTIKTILSTFKFLDQNITNETANWITRNSSYCNVQFTIPPNQAPYFESFQGQIDPNYRRFWQLREKKFQDKSNDGNSVFLLESDVMYVADVEAGGSVAGLVRVRCAPNNSSYKLNDLPNVFASGYGVDAGIQIRNKVKYKKWDKDILISQFDGGLFGDNKVYFVQTKNYIYAFDTKVGSQSDFVKNTTDNIFNSIKFLE